MEKLKPISSNVSNLQHRWFWELLQNASDYNDSVDVILELRPNEVIFMHNGKPFRPSDAENLIAPDSGKDSEELQQKDMIGQFGTGFISTHVVSPVVVVEGVIQSETEEDQFLKFKFTLDRTAFDDKEALKLSIPATSKQLDESIEQISYKPGNFYTRFTYDLTKALPSIDPNEVVKKGLQYIHDILPYTLAFLPKVKSVTIKNFKTDFVEYENRVFKSITSDEDFTVEICLLEHAKPFETIHFNLFQIGDTELIVRVEDNKIQSYPDGITKLFCSLPMIGTEAFSFPIVLNSRKFVPHVERDGISLTSNDKANRKILIDAVKAHKELITELTEIGTQNWSCIVSWQAPSFKIVDEKTWFKGEIIDKIKSCYLNAKIVQTATDWIALKDSIIPYAPSDEYTDEELLDFYDLVANWRVSDLPTRSEFLNWYNNLDFSVFSGLNYSLEDFVKEVSELGSIDRLKVENEKPYQWISEILQFVLGKSPDLLDKYGIIPNRLDNFTRRKDPIFWNNKIDDFLFQIHELLTGKDYQEILIHPSIQVDNLFESKRTKTTIDLAKEIDDSFSEYHGDKQAPKFLKALRLTFQWARQSGRPESELKELFKWFASHRPQLFLETFDDDDRDKAFSIAQSGKLDALSKLAESSLTNQDINSMIAIGKSGVDMAKMSEIASLSKEVGADAIIESAKDLAEEKRELLFKKEVGESVEEILNKIFEKEFPDYIATLERTKEYDLVITNKSKLKNRYFIELKSIRDNNSDPVKMGIHQARKAKDFPDNYALLLIRRPTQGNLTEEYLRANILCDYQIGKDVIKEVEKADAVDAIVKSLDSIKLENKDPTMKVQIRQQYLEKLGKTFDALKTKIHEAIR